MRSKRSALRNITGYTYESRKKGPDGELGEKETIYVKPGPPDSKTHGAALYRHQVGVAALAADKEQDEVCISYFSLINTTNNTGYATLFRVQIRLREKKEAKKAAEDKRLEKAERKKEKGAERAEKVANREKRTGKKRKPGSGGDRKSKMAKKKKASSPSDCEVDLIWYVYYV